jgi:hypothetical protein
VGDEMNIQDIHNCIKEYIYLEALNNGVDWEELFAIDNPEWNRVNASILMVVFNEEEYTDWCLKEIDNKAWEYFKTGKLDRYRPKYLFINPAFDKDFFNNLSKHVRPIKWHEKLYYNLLIKLKK